MYNTFLCDNFISSLLSSKLPKRLKLTEITPLHKKGKKNLKGNYRPIINIPILSKIYIFMVDLFLKIYILLVKILILPAM